MANPELRQHRDLDPAWVEYAQGRLIEHLRAQADAGDIELSAIDGDFGDKTDASVRFLQQQRGLDVDGIIGPDTWEVLEADPPEAPAAEDAEDAEDADGAEDAAEPIDLRIPFELQMNWDELRVEDMLREFTDLKLDEHPGLKLSFLDEVGPLFANGGKTWLELEFNNHPQVYVDLSTRAIINWAGDNGVELGADNELEAGLRFRALDIFVTGELDVRFQPMVPSGSISGGGMLNLRLRLGEIGR